MNFDTVNLSQLDGASSAALNAAAFGIVKMSHDGKVTDYNDWQSKFTGISKENTIGKHFFSQVAPCTNNFLVSQKYDSNPSLDEKLDYTFTLKMAPTPVKLRLLKGPNTQYLLCNR